MAYETSLLIVIFSFCSYVLMRVKKLEVFSMLVALAPLIFYAAKDYALIPFLLVASLCLMTRERTQVPFMICFISIWALAKMPLELELLSYYLALTLARPGPNRKSLDMILPLGFIATLITAQFNLIERSSIISLACPLMMMSLWHHLYLIDQEYKQNQLIEGRTLFQLSIVAYLLPLKLSEVMGQATTYVNPTMLNFGLWAFVIMALLFTLWSLLRDQRRELVSLVCALMRSLVLIPMWSGEQFDVRLYLLTLLFVEIIGQLILTLVASSLRDKSEVGARVVILGFLYQFLFLPGSLGALVLAEISNYEQKHTDLIWKVGPIVFVVAILVATFNILIGLNRELRGPKVAQISR